MKRLNHSLLTRLVLLICIFNAATFLVAQDCEPYFPMEEGSVLEHTSYDKKGKTQSRSVQKITAKYWDGTDLTAELSGTTYDEKGNELNNMSYTVKCQNGNFLIDLKGIVPSDSWNQYQGMEININGDFLEIPPNPNVGDQLPDAQLTVSVTNSGIAISTIVVIITDRKVEKKESVTTEAGTFDCIMFSYNVTTEIGALPIRSKASSKDWYAKSVGMVKQETFNKKGKLTGSTKLTGLIKP